MDRSRRDVIALIAGTTALAGCVGDDDDTDDTADTTDDSDDDVDDADMGDNGDPDDTDSVEVTVSDHDDFGEILTDADGYTLYMFDQDEQGADSTACDADCEESWPPLFGEKSEAGDGVTATLGSFERDDGEYHVTANGWPLYYWVGDDEPGETDGQGVNDVWWVLDAAGEPIDEAADADDDDDGATGPGDADRGY